MPILCLQLKQDASGIKEAVQLSGSVPKQPLTLVHYSINLASQDTSADAFFVQLPFLNNFDVNSNFDVTHSIPLFMKPSDSQGTHDVQCNYEFNPARNIDEVFSNWYVYDESGNIYTNKAFTITLVFNYRRAELV